MARRTGNHTIGNAPAYAGKLDGARKVHIKRDTPAYARKTTKAADYWDGTDETPPRMRGKPLTCPHISKKLRNTPAYAGKNFATSTFTGRNPALASLRAMNPTLQQVRQARQIGC